jgi:hypothetical protein
MQFWLGPLVNHFTVGPPANRACAMPFPAAIFNHTIAAALARFCSSALHPVEVMLRPGAAGNTGNSAPLHVS